VSNPADRLSGQQTHCAPSDETGGRRALAHASIESKEKSRIPAEENHSETPEQRRSQNRAEAPVAGRVSVCEAQGGGGRNAHHNLLNEPMLRELADGIACVAEREDVKLIVLDSACKIFCGGIDVGEYTSERVFQMVDAFHSVFLGILESSKPVMCVVNGPAIGGGAELAAFGDLVIATPKARFAQPEITIGVFPPLATTILPYLVGPKVALELVLLGEAVTAEQAHQLGLVNRLVPEAQLEHTVNDLISRVTSHSGPVLTMAKKAILGGMGLSLRDGLKNSMSIFLNELYRLEDAQEGLRALVEKRKPNWKNR
jgi:cyclohexa-1,5-dienecarbonyl-CoA hydratase